MYHAIVRRRIRALFDAINRGDATPILEAFAGTFEHRFLGQHALGGGRTDLYATRLWYERLFRLMPDITFVIRDIVVTGTPWNTLVLIEWDETNSGTDGVPTANSGCHVVHLAWGRMTRLLICPDTVPLVDTFKRLAAKGTAEAVAAKIES